MALAHPDHRGFPILIKVAAQFGQDVEQMLGRCLDCVRDGILAQGVRFKAKRLSDAGNAFAETKSQGARVDAPTIVIYGLNWLSNNAESGRGDVGECSRCHPVVPPVSSL